jgi:hypothetical protein
MRKFSLAKIKHAAAQRVQNNQSVTVLALAQEIGCSRRYLWNYILGVRGLREELGLAPASLKFVGTPVMCWVEQHALARGATVSAHNTPPA